MLAAAAITRRVTASSNCLPDGWVADVDVTRQLGDGLRGDGLGLSG